MLRLRTQGCVRTGYKAGQRCYDSGSEAHRISLDHVSNPPGVLPSAAHLGRPSRSGSRPLAGAKAATYTSPTADRFHDDHHLIIVFMTHIMYIVKWYPNRGKAVRVTRKQAAANREKVLDVAGKLFREHGFEGIGVADIMKRAGLTHGGFYGQFASKDNLA